MINIIKKVIIGIYKITSPSGKCYIGQSINIETRKGKHKSKPDFRQPKLYNSLIKYKFENHKFEILQECKVEELNKLEVHWKLYYLYINNWDWGKVLFHEIYDLNISGPRSKETIDKIRKTKLGKKYNIDPNRSRENFKGPKSEEHKRNMRKPKPNSHKPKSEVWKKSRYKPIIQYDINGNIVREWESQKQARIETKIHNIRGGLKFGKIVGGCNWKYKV